MVFKRTKSSECLDGRNINLQSDEENLKENLLTCHVARPGFGRIRPGALNLGHQKVLAVVGRFFTANVVVGRTDTSWRLSSSESRSHIFRNSTLRKEDRATFSATHLRVHVCSKKPLLRHSSSFKLRWTKGEYSISSHSTELSYAPSRHIPGELAQYELLPLAAPLRWRWRRRLRASVHRCRCIRVHIPRTAPTTPITTSSITITGVRILCRYRRRSRRRRRVRHQIRVDHFPGRTNHRRSHATQYVSPVDL